MAVTSFSITPRRLHAAVHDRGDGPWLTLLHSLATNSGLWAPQVEQLSRSHRLLLIDMRGHGGSDGEAGEPVLPDLADDVVAVWDHLGIQESAVVGLSIGGMTALGLGLDHPERVTRLVAADCRADAPDFFRAMWDERRRVVREGGMEAVLEATLASWLTPATRLAQPELEAGVAAMITGTSVNGYMAATHALSNLDYLHRLGTLTRPVLYLCGAEDGPHPAVMHAMAAATPGSRYIQIPGAAHLSNLEQPPAFNHALAEFFA